MSSTGGESTDGVPVTIRVYDITRGMASQFGPALLGHPIEGIWHSGIEVFGIEYFFSGGIVQLPPSQVELEFGLRPSRIQQLGRTRKTREEVQAFLQSISHRFTLETYDLINWNCNHFTSELCRFLLGVDIPDYILNQARELTSTPIGKMLLPMLQQQQQQQQSAAAAAGQGSLWTMAQQQERLQQQQVQPQELQLPKPTSPYGTLLRDVCSSTDTVPTTRRLFLLTLRTILNNVLKTPREEKFLTLKKENPIIKSKVLRLSRGLEALQLLGFVEERQSQENQPDSQPEEVVRFTKFDGVTDAKQIESVEKELRERLSETEAFISALGGATDTGAASHGTVPISSPVATTPPRQEFGFQLQQLRDMGFKDEEANRRALQAVNGVLNAAIDRLLQ